MTSKPVLVTAAGIAMLLAGCASTPFNGSYLVGNRYFKTPIDTQPVIILGVDDWDTTLHRVLVEPGRTPRARAGTAGAGRPVAHGDAETRRQTVCDVLHRCGATNADHG